MPLVPSANSASVVSICRTFTLASRPCVEIGVLEQLYCVDPTLTLTRSQSGICVDDELERSSPCKAVYSVLLTPYSLPTAFR